MIIKGHEVTLRSPVVIQKLRNLVKIEQTVVDNKNPINNLITVYYNGSKWYTANAVQIWGDNSKHYWEIGSEQWMHFANEALYRGGVNHLRYLLTGERK